ncbi:MAG: amidase, partial [Acidimicrobiia bacterium]|nr:amidase [Acidimicrobiia bacterium]
MHRRHAGQAAAPRPRVSDPPADDAGLEEALARIAEREPEVRAWRALHPPEELRARWAEMPAGPLHRVTLGVKDIIDTADLTTERGSPIYAGHRPRADAACVALARAGGALVVGKTVSTEFAYTHPGPTRNPHDPAHTPGGSSSGSAAAVAAGMARVAFGTQTAGSVIRPGSFCGVPAFKATFGLVPLTGVHPLAPSFDTLGWYGRDLDDVAAVLEALAPAAEGAPALPTMPRIGLYRGEDWPAAEPATADALAAAAGALRAAGAEVVEVAPAPPLAGLGEAH